MAFHKQRMEDVPASVLAVFAHPDDMEMSCGGTLAAWAGAGCKVSVLVATVGDKGSLDPTADPRDVARRRAEELAAAAEVLGVEEVESWGLPDGEVEDHRARLRGRLVAKVRSAQPEVVIGHDPTPAFIGRYYVNHIDHRAVGWLTVDAVAPAAWSPLYYQEAGPAHRVRRLLLAGSPEPDVVIDIGGQVERKAMALACHRSQLGDQPPDHEALEALVRSRGRAAGAQSPVEIAETFRLLEPS